jgi:hypothetical protein
VLTYVFTISAAAGLLAALSYCLEAGFRNGDRPGDARVTALPATGAQPGTALPGTVPPAGTSPLIVVTVRNPSGTPVLAALGARRAVLPALLADPRAVSVPRRTGRGRFRPGRFEAVGVVPAGGMAELAVPAPVPISGRARRYVLTVAVGQEGGRLRVHRLRLGPVSYTAEDRPTIMVE